LHDCAATFGEPQLEQVELNFAAVQREKYAPAEGLDRAHDSKKHEHDLEKQTTIQKQKSRAVSPGFLWHASTPKD
jgi:hypothetical protein